MAAGPEGRGGWMVGFAVDRSIALVPAAATLLMFWAALWLVERLDLEPVGTGLQVGPR